MAEEAVKISAVDQRLKILNKYIKELESCNTKKASSASVGKNNSQTIKNFKTEQKNVEDIVKMYLEHIKNVYEAINETKETIVEIDELTPVTPTELLNKVLIKNRFTMQQQGITDLETYDQLQSLKAINSGEYEMNPNIALETYIGYSLKADEVEKNKTKAQKVLEEHPDALNKSINVESYKSLQNTLQKENWEKNPKIKKVEINDNELIKDAPTFENIDKMMDNKTTNPYINEKEEQKLKESFRYNGLK